MRQVNIKTPKATRGTTLSKKRKEGDNEKTENTQQNTSKERTEGYNKIQ